MKIGGKFTWKTAKCIQPGSCGYEYRDKQYSRRTGVNPGGAGTDFRRQIRTSGAGTDFSRQILTSLDV